MNHYSNLSDFHIHSHFSSDSIATPESMVEKAISLGLSSICFTDHNDFGYPAENGKILFLLDMNSYISKIHELIHKYKDKITIYLGVEQGLQKSYAKEIENFGINYDLDFIIGSSHMVEGMDPYYKDYWIDKSSKEGTIRYFRSILENILSIDQFDVYGHLDYIIRYIPDKNFLYKPSEFSDVIDEILKALIQKGKGIECNTSGIKYGLNQTHPSSSILKRYRELGGEIITIGSDGHKPEHLAYAYDQVSEIMKSSGFFYYTIFEKRKPTFIKL